jgi:N-acetylmuramoyl-L-alanine amidase
LLATVPLGVAGLVVLPTIQVEAEARPVEPVIQTIPLESAGNSEEESSGGTLRSTGPSGRLETDTLETKAFQLAAVTWTGTLNAGMTVWARTRADGRWSRWTELPVDDADHAPDPGSAEADDSRGGTEPLIVAESDAVQVRVAPGGAGRLPAGIRIDLVDPGESSADSTVGAASLSSASAVTAKPQIFTRAQWGADETIREPGDPDYGQVLGGFVHHTAGTNSYLQSDVPGIIRSIYAYHVNGRGWRDIGYNFLVDRFGRIWEGRYGGVDRAVVGAHTAGYNSNAFGMSVLGTYRSKQPETALLDAYERLFAWKFSLHGVEPTASVAYPDQKTLPAISGHRDGGSTECPGQLLYDALPTIRAGTAATMGRQVGAGDLAIFDNAGGSAWMTSVATNGVSWLGSDTAWATSTTRLLGGDVDGDDIGDAVLVRPTSLGLSLDVVPWHSGGYYETDALTRWSTISGGGWSFTASRQLMGDVTGDSLDDVVSVHRQSNGGVLMFVHRNTGGSFAAPVVWQDMRTGGWSFDNSRQTLADLDGDGVSDIATSHAQPNGGVLLWAHLSTGSSLRSPALWADLRTGGWSYSNSRQAAGDVDGDGRDDILTSHRQPNGGVLLWAHVSTGSSFRSPALWQDLRSGGWSYANSKQLLVDTDDDGRDDVVTAHRDASTGGYRIWLHDSTGASFQSPSLYWGVIAGRPYDGMQMAISSRTMSK